MSGKIQNCTAISLYRPRLSPINMRAVLRNNNVSVVSHPKTEGILGAQTISPRMEVLLQKARDLSLSLEIGRLADLPESTLQNVLAYAINEALTYGEELKSINVNLVAGKIVATPRTWERELRDERNLNSLTIAHRAIEALDTELSRTATKDEAEIKVAQILCRDFKACRIKVYEVAVDGSVRVSHSFARSEANGEILRENEVDSHFKEWAPPESYVGEAMDDVVLKEHPYVIISSPARDTRCMKKAADGTTVFFESHPFALIGERIGGRIVKVYKVDWEKEFDLTKYAEGAIKGLFVRLAEFKKLKTSEEEMMFLDRTSQIAASENDLHEILQKISGHLAYFFSQEGRYVAERITIMLYDPSIEALSTHMIWTPEDVHEVDYLSPKQDMGVASRIFHSGERSVYIKNAAVFRSQKIHWRLGGRGSILATVVEGSSGKAGIIMVSSSRVDAFSQEQRKMLENVSERVGPAFERIARHIEELNLDTKFGTPKFGSLKVYNPKFLESQLAMDIKTAESGGNTFSVIFIDVDKFKDLNETGTHGDVDYVLAEIIARAIRNTRDGKVFRHGGEELVVKVPIPPEQAEIIAKRLLKAVGENDIIVRIPYPDRLEAAKMISQIRDRQEIYPNNGIKNATVEVGRDGEVFLVLTVRKTISIGVAGYSEGDTPDSIINKADQAMQHSKANGRNTVTIYR